MSRARRGRLGGHSGELESNQVRLSHLTLLGGIRSYADIRIFAGRPAVFCTFAGIRILLDVTPPPVHPNRSASSFGIQVARSAGGPKAARGHDGAGVAGRLSQPIFRQRERLRRRLKPTSGEREWQLTQQSVNVTATDTVRAGFGLRQRLREFRTTSKEAHAPVPRPTGGAFVGVAVSVLRQHSSS